MLLIPLQPRNGDFGTVPSIAVHDDEQEGWDTLSTLPYRGCYTKQPGQARIFSWDLGG
jgi:hypothetical protein